MFTGVIEVRHTLLNQEWVGCTEDTTDTYDIDGVLTTSFHTTVGGTAWARVAPCTCDPEAHPEKTIVILSCEL